MKLSIRIPALSVCLLLASLGGTAVAQSGITGIQMPPAYNTFVPPSQGGTYVDPVFGSTIKRITNATQTPNSDQGGNLTWIENEYSAASAFNSDNSRFILLHQSYFAVYDGAGVYQHDLPFEINGSSEPRWSRKDNVTLYYHTGNMLKSYNVVNGNIAVVHTFSEYSSISGNGEMDISLDGDHFVLAGDGRYIFVYQISTDTKFAVFDTGAVNFDSLYITPNNNVVVSWFTSGTVRFSGQELFDTNMNFLRQVGHADGHKHLTRDSNGSEVLIWTNSDDPQPISNCQNGIVKILLADASQTCLAQLDWSLAVHITAPDGNGSVFVETYAPGNPDPASSAWVAYTNELLQVKLDGSGVVRLAQHRSRPFDSYLYEPKMTSSRDGTRLLYASNYDLQTIDGNPTNYSDTYLIVLGESTTSPVVSTTTPPASTTPPVSAPTGTPVPPPPASSTAAWVRYEQDNSAVQYGGGWYPNLGAANSGGSAVLAMDAGSQATLTFTGTGVKWIGFSDPWSGIAQVYLDGALLSTVDTWSASQQTQAVQYSVSNLSNSTHTLAIVATGNRNSQSEGAWVWVDAFDVAGSADSASANGPVVTAVVNAASGGADIAPGSLISIQGSQFASVSASASVTPLPAQLQGVTVLVNGIAIPLSYVSPNQINAQVPFGLSGAASLVVSTATGPSTPISFGVVATAPELFRVNGSQGLAINQDQTINGSNSPAASGSTIVVYVNGQGDVDHAVATGNVALSSPLSLPNAPASATLDGQPIQVSSFSLAPGLVGVSRANIQLPSVGSGNHSLVIQVGNSASEPVMIAVQ